MSQATGLMNQMTERMKAMSRFVIRDCYNKYHVLGEIKITRTDTQDNVEDAVEAVVSEKCPWYRICTKTCAEWQVKHANRTDN